jgi:SnoaL-like protein
MRKHWKMFAAAALGAALMFVAVQAQQKTTYKGPSLTAQDYAEIQQLIARYPYALDTCSNNGRDYAALYTSDGTFIDLWSQNGVKEGGIKWQGPEKLAEAAGGGSLGCKKSGIITHFIVNHAITPSPEGATGKSYLLSGGGAGNPDVVQKNDYYEDVYVKTPDGWRIKQRAHLRDKARTTGIFTPGVYPVGDPRGATPR